MKNVGDGRRISRVEKEVQMQVAQYLISGLSTPLPGLVTVTHVKMPADLRTAQVFVSVLADQDSVENVISLLQKRAFEVQNYISQQLKMRYCPKLTFLKDHTTEQVLKIEKILHDLKSTQKPDTE